MSPFCRENHRSNMITAGLVALLLSVQVSAAVHGMESSSSHGDQDCELCQIFDRPAVFQVGPAATFERSASRALAQGGESRWPHAQTNYRNPPGRAPPRSQEQLRH